MPNFLASRRFGWQGTVVADAPTTATDPGQLGQIAFDAGYVYVCVADNTWRRAALTSW